MHSCGIDKNDLFFAGSLTKLFEKRASENKGVVLVDHTQMEPTSDFKRSKILEIIDHHPLSPGYERPESCNFFLVERVGSCSSLVADELVKRLPRELIPTDLCQLLYGL